MAEEELLKDKDDNKEVEVDVEFKLIENVVEEFRDVSDEVLIMAKSVQMLAKAELYDSGCMNHISPYKSSFKIF